MGPASQIDPHAATAGGKPRARSLGIPFGGQPGRWNAITDVPGVEIGYATLIQGHSVRTGVTAIHPRGPAGAAGPVTAGFFSQNGNGEVTGVSWIEESGTFVRHHQHARRRNRARCHRRLDRPAPSAGSGCLAAACGGGDLGRLPERHQLAARHGGQGCGRAGVERLRAGRGGLRRRRHRDELLRVQGRLRYRIPAGRLRGHSTYTVGVFVQANFGSRAELMLAGLPLGKLLSGDYPMPGHFAAPPGAGSVIAIVATDAPLLPGQCKAFARRVTLGLARTGTAGSHFSGDLFLAFSTGNPGGVASTAGTLGAGGGTGYGELRYVPWGFLDPFYAAVVQGTEEAVANALAANEDMAGRDGHRSPALPRERVAGLFAARRQARGGS